MEKSLVNKLNIKLPLDLFWVWWVIAIGSLLSLVSCEEFYLQIAEGYQVKGAMRFGTFKSIDFKKNWYVKVPVVPRSLML